MDITFFDDNQSTSPIQKDTDPAKYDAIAMKLCDKRKLLEEKTHNSTLAQAEREDSAINLIQIKKDMEIFGISEVDYQAYLAHKEKQTNETLEESSQKNKIAPESQSPLLIEPD
jgi:hypothetical protein